MRIETEPMMEMNTTPLIDVMLVLIIMLIITIPMQTHSVKLDLPGGPPPVEVGAVSNTLTIGDTGAVAWNGTRVSRAQLAELLDTAAQAELPPELHLKPTAQAPYRVVDEVLVAVKRADVRKVGFVGNEAYAEF